ADAGALCRAPGFPDGSARPPSRRSDRDQPQRVRHVSGRLAAAGRGRSRRRRPACRGRGQRAAFVLADPGDEPAAGAGARLYRPWQGGDGTRRRAHGGCAESRNWSVQFDKTGSSIGPARRLASQASPSRGHTMPDDLTTPAYIPTARSRVRRHPERAHYDRETVFAILDAALMCHIGYLIDGRPYVTPTLFWRE